MATRLSQTLSIEVKGDRQQRLGLVTFQDLQNPNHFYEFSFVLQTDESFSLNPTCMCP